ncbi:MAG TPA: D-aminoacyl-tRNA deacylase [Polyangiaceae bacterium]
MKAVLQRVTRAEVRVDGAPVGAVARGLLVLVGVAHGDTANDADALAEKIATLRIFEDGAGKMNLAVTDVAGGVLAVSQFTLLADTSRGRRPSFTGAMPPQEAEALFERFCGSVRALGLRVETGRFGASMQVELVNDGPVTILLDTQRS